MMKAIYRVKMINRKTTNEFMQMLGVIVTIEN